MPLEINVGGKFEPVTQNTQPDPARVDNSTSFIQALGANFEQNNIAVSGYNYLSDSNVASPETAADYDNSNPFKTPQEESERMQRYFAKALDDGITMSYAQEFMHVRTDEQYNATKANAMRSMTNDDIISRSSGVNQFVTGALAGVLDPTLLLGGLVAPVKIARAGSVAMTAAKGAAILGASAAAENTASEYALSQTQIGRSNKKGFFADNNYLDAAIGGGILGGVVGGGVNGISALRNRVDVSSFEKELGDLALNPNRNNEFETAFGFGNSSASAAQAKTTSIDDEGVIIKNGLTKGKASELYNKVTAKILDNPVQRGLMSPFKSARTLTQDLAETSGLKIAKAEKGIAVAKGGAIESLNKLSKGAYYRAKRLSTQEFLKYRQHHSKWFTRAKLEISDLVNKPKEFLTEREFQKQVGVALQNGDTHAIPEVQRAAQIYRKEVFDPLKNRAIELGVLPEDVSVETSQSYFSRVYDHHEIKKNLPAFHRIIKDWLEEERVKKADIQEKIEPLIQERDVLKREISDKTKKTEKRNVTTEKLKLQVEEGAKYVHDVRSRLGLGNGMLKKIQKSYSDLQDVIAEKEGISDTKLSILNEQLSDALPRLNEALGTLFINKRNAVKSKQNFNAMVRRAKNLIVPERDVNTDNGVLGVETQTLPQTKKTFTPQTKYPVLGFFKGEINTKGRFADILKTLDITPQTFPGYFSKTGRYAEIDNIPTSEFEELFNATGKGIDDNAGYFDPNDIIDAIDAELSGKPVFLYDNDVVAQQRFNDTQSFSDELERLGIDINDPNAYDKYKSSAPDIEQTDFEGIDFNAAQNIADELDFYDRAMELLPSLRNDIDVALKNIEKIDPTKKLGLDPALRKLKKEFDAIEESLQADFKKSKQLKVSEKNQQKTFNTKEKERGILNNSITKRASNKLKVLLRKIDESKNISRQTQDAEYKLANIEDKISELASNWQSKTGKKFNKGSVELDDILKVIQNTETRADLTDLMYLAQEITQQILSTPDGRLPYSHKINADKNTSFSSDQAKPSFLKNRTLMIPDDRIRDFLVMDADIVSGMMTNRLAPYLNLYEKFDGDIELKGVMKDIETEYLKSLQGKTPEKVQVLSNQYNNAIENIAIIRDRALGTDRLSADPSSVGTRVHRALRTMNVITYLGGMAFSALADLGRIRLAGRTIYTIPFKAMNKEFRKGWFDKMDELSDLGVVTEIVASNTYLSLSDVGGGVLPKTRIERGIEYVGGHFGTLSGMSLWNQTMKQMIAMNTESTILKSCKKLIDGTATKEQISALANNGIDTNMAERILSEFNTHGEIHKGLNLLNAQNWTDKQAKNGLLSALSSEVDRIIITPGYDKSVMLNSNEYWKTIAQFKSFAVAATSRLLGRSIQDGLTAQNIEHFTIMMALGALIYASKTKQGGRELSDNPAIWAVEAFDRAGIGGIFSEGNNILEKVTGLGVRPIFDDVEGSRYATRSPADAVLGPSFGRLVNTMNLFKSIAEGDFSEQDVNTIMGFIPGQNLPIMTTDLMGVANENLRTKVKETISDTIK